ncbi:hypothetical protein [Kitasatospora cineracea]|uniref:Uncharacterized protein n=1 Tax=Kitasatospora cineracea TaxID=88074 RepID=A0A8G1XD57_9ACTN|nr:hypothetical protein [Kitasatospora cineracea]ROR44703.1 hypothetical protein EDD39_2910 [Kitasatospora cineracea]
MQNFTHDRYAEQPPSSWVGRHWLSTTRDGSGGYLRGLILDVRPGAVLVEWPASGGEAATEQWTSRDRGTLARE